MCTARGLLPLPPSISHGVRSPLVLHRPRPFQPAFGIVDAPVEALGVEAHRVRDADHDHLAVLQRDEAVVEVGGRHRDVLAQPEGVVLIDPGVVARLGAGLLAIEARARIAVEDKALRAMIAGRVGPVERTLALAPVEAHEAAVRSRSPNDAVLVDVAAADAVAVLRQVVDLRQSGRGIEAQESGRAARKRRRCTRPSRRSGAASRHRVRNRGRCACLWPDRSAGWARRSRRACRCRSCRGRTATSPATLAASPVSSNILVLTQPATGPVPESHSVSSAS